jgi:hypothetical protein
MNGSVMRVDLGYSACGYVSGGVDLQTIRQPHFLPAVTAIQRSGLWITAPGFRDFPHWSLATGNSTVNMAATDGKLFQSISSQILDLPPSCVEFCPAFPSYFLVGTYSLETQTQNAGPSSGDVESDDDERGGQSTQPKQPQSRNGSIIAFQILDGAMWVPVDPKRSSSAALIWTHQIPCRNCGSALGSPGSPVQPS